MGNIKALYACPREFKYFEETDSGYLIIPRGLYSRIISNFERERLLYEIVDQRSSPLSSNRLKHTDTKLLEYQISALKEILDNPYGQGIIRIDTGWGKSILATKLVEALNIRTLIVVPRLNILKQFKQICNNPGIIQGKEFSIKDITLATSQSLIRAINKGQLSRDRFGMCIYDECHLTVPRKTRVCVEYFCAKYRFGFTATARRTDGQGRAIEFLFGPIICDRKMERKQPKVKIIYSYGIYTSWDYHEIIDKQTKDEQRNKAIAEEIIKQVEEGHKVIVLTKRIIHHRDIESCINGFIDGSIRNIKIVQLSSKDNSKSHNTQFDNLRSNPDSFDCILGTFSLLSTGIDIPSLDTLIIAGDLKSDILQEQSVGRILRLLQNKKDPLIIDFVDKNQPVLYRQYLTRKKFYKEQGWEIICPKK